MPNHHLLNPLIKIGQLAAENNRAFYATGYALMFAGFALVVSFVVLLIIDLHQSRRANQPVEKSLPVQAFGQGSQHNFDWYFEGQSRVDVSSIDDICAWLRECDYIHDRVLFMKQDFWQHPLTFEQLRKGDCEDHALWAWRKLKEVGVSAQFIVGHTQPAGYHAWVVFRLGDGHYLLETTNKSGLMIYPLVQTKRYYKPEVGIDHQLRMYRYSRKS